MTAPAFHTCPLTGRPVVFAPDRAARPDQFHELPFTCPFCGGNEHDTPAAVLTVPDPAGGWRLRVVPNKFPAVGGDLPGYHEVVIEGYTHESDPTRLPADVRGHIWKAYRERMRAHAADERIRCVVPFKNVGADAGASLEHSHSQILSVGFVPPEVRREAEGFAGGFRLAELQHVVAESGSFVAACPPAPRLPYEVWLFPRRPTPDYRTITDAECDELAGLMNRVLTAIGDVAGRPSFNWFVHTAPVREVSVTFHWHVEVVPRTARPAGFEWATGAYINPVPADRGANALREAMGRG